MGWKANKANRQLILASGRAFEHGVTCVNKRHPRSEHVARQSSGSNANIVWPEGESAAVGDWPAVVRALIPKASEKADSSLFCKSVSNITRSALKVLMASSPTRVEIFFDRRDSSAFPPQRAAVAAERYSSDPDPDVLAELLRQLNCDTLDDVEGLDPEHRGYRESSNIDWSSMFTIPRLKQWAWKVFVASVVDECVQATAKGDEWAEGCIFHVWCPDGKTCFAISDGIYTIKKKKCDPFGEADLRSFYCAARISQKSRVPVVLHTIDTDLLLCAMSATWFCPEQPFLISLKAETYNVNDMIHKLSNGNAVIRLNFAFWMFLFGCDYIKPLTNFGFYSKSFVEILKSRVQEPYTEVKPGKIEFSLEKALKVLSFQKRAKKKEKPEKTLESTLLDMDFCLRYYGLMFDISKMSFPGVASGSNTFITKPMVSTVAQKRQLEDVLGKDSKKLKL